MKSNPSHWQALASRKISVLRSLRHYLRAQSRGHHIIDRLEERGVERGSARRSSLKGRERAIVSQTNIRTVSKATLGKLSSERRDGAHTGFSERIDTSWTELNWTELIIWNDVCQLRTTFIFVPQREPRQVWLFLSCLESHGFHLISLSYISAFRLVYWRQNTPNKQKERTKNFTHLTKKLGYNFYFAIP